MTNLLPNTRTVFVHDHLYSSLLGKKVVTTQLQTSHTCYNTWTLDVWKVILCCLHYGMALFTIFKLNVILSPAGHAVWHPSRSSWHSLQRPVMMIYFMSFNVLISTLQKFCAAMLSVLKQKSLLVSHRSHFGPSQRMLDLSLYKCVAYFTY